MHPSQIIHGDTESSIYNNKLKCRGGYQWQNWLCGCNYSIMGKPSWYLTLPSFFFFFYWRALRQPDTLLGAFDICSGSKFVWEASPHLPLTRSRLY